MTELNYDVCISWSTVKISNIFRVFVIFANDELRNDF